MRRIAIVVLLIAIVTFSIYLLHPRIFDHARAPMPTPTAETQADCSLKNLTAHISFEGAAGSTYATATLKNTSSMECILHGNLYIDPRYDHALSNVSVIHNTPIPAPILVLAPQVQATATIHYLNGAQCNSQTKSVSVQFVYTLSNTENLIFSDNTGRKSFQIQICSDSSEVSMIDSTPLSLTK